MQFLRTQTYIDRDAAELLFPEELELLDGSPKMRQVRLISSGLVPDLNEGPDLGVVHAEFVSWSWSRSGCHFNEKLHIYRLVPQWRPDFNIVVNIIGDLMSCADPSTKDPTAHYGGQETSECRSAHCLRGGRREHPTLRQPCDQDHAPSSSASRHHSLHWVRSGARPARSSRCSAAHYTCYLSLSGQCTFTPIITMACPIIQCPIIHHINFRQ